MRFLSLAFTVVSFAIAGSALAAETAAGGHSGLPQLNPESFVSQAFWLIVIFFVLYGIMAKIALPRIGTVIDARRQRISDDLAAATAAKDQAAAVIAAYEAELSKARTKAQNALQTATERAQAHDRHKQQHLAESLARDLASAEARILTAKKDAMTGLRQVATEITSSITQRLTGETPDAASVTAAIDAVGKAR